MNYTECFPAKDEENERTPKKIKCQAVEGREVHRGDTMEKTSTLDCTYDLKIDENLKRNIPIIIL